MEHSVPVTEELADKLSLAKGEANEETRVHILEKVAECAMSQGNYHLATKKFLLAGSMVMKLFRAFISYFLLFRFNIVFSNSILLPAFVST